MRFSAAVVSTLCATVLAVPAPAAAPASKTVKPSELSRRARINRQNHFANVRAARSFSPDVKAEDDSTWGQDASDSTDSVSWDAQPSGFPSSGSSDGSSTYGSPGAQASGGYGSYGGSSTGTYGSSGAQASGSFPPSSSGSASGSSGYGSYGGSSTGTYGSSGSQASGASVPSSSGYSSNAYGSSTSGSSSAMSSGTSSSSGASSSSSSSATASDDDDLNESWSGVVTQNDEGTITGVSASFKLPTISKPSEGAQASKSSHTASTWIGIDGVSCTTGLWQAGVDGTIDSSGSVTWYAWYEWYPAGTQTVELGDLAAGDTVFVNVTASSTTAGTVTMENKSNGKSFTKSMTSSDELCLADAEWIQEDLIVDGGDTGLAKFSTITFEDAVATSDSGDIAPTTGTFIMDIEDSEGNQLTQSSATSNTVVIEYIMD